MIDNRSYGSASWSADSKNLLFTSKSPTDYIVSTVSVATMSNAPVGNDPNALEGYPFGGGPRWSSDGQLITYATVFTVPGTSNTSNQIAVIHNNGTNLKRFDVSGNASFARWQPWSAV